jgi:outer membrane receptor protein involved in Fe transport
MTDASYEFSFSQNWMDMKNTGLQTSSKNFVQKLSGNFSPNKKWLVRVSGEHYNNEISAGLSKHFFLADAEVTYVLKSGLEFNLSVRNILNQDVYAYTTFGGLIAISREYTIRPRNVLASVYFRF